MEFYNSVQDYVEQQLGIREHQFIDWFEMCQRICKDKSLEGSFLGSYSLTTRNRKLTYVAEHHDWCKNPVSASTIARLILRSGLSLLGRRRIYWNRKSRPLLDIPQPLYCKPLEYGGRLTYVDISRAYYSIYRRMPMDISFQGLRVYSGETWFGDFLPKDLCDYKLVRNSLVGAFRALTQARIKDGKVDVKQNRNNLLSPEHWGYIAHLLHTLAWSAVNCGARYVNTDGAIFLRDEDAIAWSCQLNKWGLEPGIKCQGSGYIASIGNYRVGVQSGGRVNPKPLEFNNLIKPSPYVLGKWIEWM